MRKQTIWFPNGSDTNRSVQLQKIARSLFGFKRDCTFPVAKTNALISFAVTAKLICAFVYAQADCWFSHVAAHLFDLRLYVRVNIFRPATVVYTSYGAPQLRKYSLRKYHDLYKLCFVSYIKQSNWMRYVNILLKL